MTLEFSKCLANTSCHVCNPLERVILFVIPNVSLRKMLDNPFFMFCKQCNTFIDLLLITNYAVFFTRQPVHFFLL